MSAADVPWRDYADYYQRGPFAPYLVEKRLAGSSPAHLLRMVQPAGDFSDPPMPSFQLMHVQRDHAPATIDAGAGRWCGRGFKGDLFCFPAGAASSIVIDGPHEVVGVCLPESGVRAMLDLSGAAPDFGRLHASPFRDSLVEALCHRLWAEASEGGPYGSLFADQMIQTLVGALMRLARGKTAQPDELVVKRPGAAALRRSIALMHDRLEEDLSLSDLAAAAGLGANQFTRAFKQAMGVPPYRYLLQQRVERAKTLLTTTDLPIAEIALDCGFCHQEHLTTMFRRLTGTTPAAYRAQVR